MRKCIMPTEPSRGVHKVVLQFLKGINKNLEVSFSIGKD